jgi:hypothetical protein
MFVVETNRYAFVAYWHGGGEAKVVASLKSAQ